MELETLVFVGGPHCGRQHRVAKVLEWYDYEDGMGGVHTYRVEPARHAGVWAAVHEGLKDGVR